MARKASYVAAREYVATCTDEECISTLVCDNPILAPLEEDIYNNAVNIENICRKLFDVGFMEKDECAKRK